MPDLFFSGMITSKQILATPSTYFGEGLSLEHYSVFVYFQYRVSFTFFMHRFRMSRDLFNRIVNGILEHDYEGYFTQTRNSAGALGLHPLQKMTAAMRMLSYGTFSFCNSITCA
jgi:hypothetical protein